MVKICVPLIIQWLYPKFGGIDFDEYVDLLTEINRVVLLANIIVKMIKIAVFTEMEASTPLYDEKTITVESKTMTAVKPSMKISEFFLFSENLA